MTTITYAIKVRTNQADLPCHISELAKGDQFYLVSKGKRSTELKVATSDPYRNGSNPGEEQWSVDCENI